MSCAGVFAQELNSGSATVILSMGTKSVNVSNCDICESSLVRRALKIGLAQ